MKNMKKLVALFAAAVMTMSLSVSAFAATVKSDGTVADKNFTLVFEAAEGDAAIDQLTMIAYLVPAETVKTVDDIPAYSSQTIVAIDQVGGEDGFGDVPVDTAKLAAENAAIAVVIGGTNIAAADTYKALITYNKEQETLTVVIGDVNGDGVVTAVDTGIINAYCGSGDTSAYNANNGRQIGVEITQGIVIGDVNGDGVVTAVDTGIINAYCGSGDTSAYNTNNGRQIGVEKKYTK